MKLSTAIVIGSFSAFCLVLIAGLIIAGKDPSTLLTSAAAIVPLVAVLFGQAVNHSDVQQVKKQTNGNLSAERARADAAEAKTRALLSAMTPEQIATTGVISNASSD